MVEILEAIKISAKRIERAIKNTDGSYSENQNSTGDTQLKLDVLGDEIIEEELKKVSSIKLMMSEEKEESVKVNENGEYLIGYDPVDGSSLVDVNQSVGSIFGIYREDFSGKNLECAVYVVYGARVDLVIAQDEVDFYRLNKSGEFEFVSKLNLSEKGQINASGATQKDWLPFHKELIYKMFRDGYHLEYAGGMVPDLHNILINRGGLFSYPATVGKDKGKLRLIFEVFPYAYIFEKAGGKATDGMDRLLDLTPEHLHDTSPCFFGSTYEIEEVKAIYAKAKR